MEIIRQRVKNYISTWLLAFFALALLCLLAFSEIFQNVVRDDGSFDSYSEPIRSDIIANIKTIRLKNRLGKYTVTLGDGGQWNLIKPRKMPAPSQTIANIFEALKTMSIHTLHQKEPINIQSFSLDNPVAILDLYTKLDEHIEIKLGLINPINNTSYITVSNQNIIYQINSLSAKLEALRLSDFVDSNIFSHDIEDIKDFALFRGKNKEATNQLRKSPSGWKSKRYRSISDDSVERTISKILSIKTHMIVDSEDEKIKNLLGNYLDNPLYRVKVKTIEGKSVDYVISGLLRSIPELKIEKRQYFLIKSSERQYPHLIHKDHLPQLQIRYSDLRLSN